RERLTHRTGAQSILGQLLRAVSRLVREEIAELAAVFVSDRRVERGPRLGNGESLLDMLQLQPACLRELLVGRGPPEIYLELSRVPAQRLPALVYGRRPADRPGLSGD